MKDHQEEALLRRGKPASDLRRRALKTSDPKKVRRLLKEAQRLDDTGEAERRV